ncbi:hypothetical protein [Bradyrhizobium japonicum]|uniref:hypothetical protein n=1 Tax=Bradyrhizobium japonicum TaxID=375 RepID=UPI000401CA05|nr:hypothetical protein [Bradyrhizobium japonicum]
MTTETQGQTSKPEDQIEVINQDTEATGADHSLNPAPVDDNPRPSEPPKPEILDQDPRAAIAARFKKLREDKEPPVETTGDFVDPSQVYGQAGKVEEEPPAPAPEPPPAQPSKRKLKVNGQEQEYTEEEVIALAQKAAAANDILEQAKERLAESKRVLETTRVHVSRQNPADNPAPTATDADDGTDGQQNPADPLKEAIEQIQYGDPDKAKEVLGKTIAEVATAAVKQVSWEDRVQADVASDLRAHDDFVKKNEDLAKDPRAAKLIRAELLDGYAEDLRKIGVPDDKIPTDATQLANLHRGHKLRGAQVRSVSKLLEDAGNSVREFAKIGAPRQETAPQKPTNPERVQVNLNRDDRRRAIPQQPQRANVQPAQTNSAPASQMDSRKAAVERAKAARGQV